MSAETKANVIREVNNKGGLHQVSYSTRMLQDICDTNPQEFGYPPEEKTPRNRRRQVQNFVDKIKSRYSSSPKRLQRKIEEIIDSAILRPRSQLLQQPLLTNNLRSISRSLLPQRNWISTTIPTTSNHQQERWLQHVAPVPPMQSRSLPALVRIIAAH